MFVIVTYDIQVKRVSKVMKICRKYLLHVQNSVFEGNITQSKLQRLKQEIENCIDKRTDSICIYQIGSLKYAHKEKLGFAECFDTIIG